MTIRSSSERETERAGEEFSSGLKNGDILALYGELGAGKTAFVRGLARGLGVKDRVTSPTYAIVNEYDGKLPLRHFDMYRLSGGDELFDIGWDDYLSAGGVIAVEWPENMGSALPADCISVRISKTGENEREISVEYPAVRGSSGSGEKNRGQSL